MYQYEVMCGETINQTTKDMARIATERKETVETDFNGVKVVVEPGEDGSRAERQYFTDLNSASKEAERKRREWEQTPEGVESLRKQKAESDRIAAILTSENGKPREFSIADRETWELGMKNNQDGYGACVYRYAARWAAMMEAAMASGATVADCADKASHDADIEGITGFMYGCAVSVLSKVWEHGEALRRWHNIKSQIGKEGERANESGGVLNPAIVSLGG